MRAIPIADNILQSRLFGKLPLRKTVQSALPIVPTVILMVIQMPWYIFAPVGILGAGVGALLFYKTPPGQMPSDYLYSWLKRTLRPNQRFKHPKHTHQNPHLIEDGGNVIERQPPAGASEDEGLFSANTIDDVPIEGIHDNGVIETERAFTKLVEIRPTVWSQQPEHQKESILSAYASYLHTVDHPIQWVTYPVPLDIQGYTDQLEDAHQNRPEDEPDVIGFGRDYHAGWVDNLTSGDDLRERRFILAISSSKFENGDGGGGMLGYLTPDSVTLGSSDADVNEHLRQLRERVETAKSTLPQCGFEDVSVLNARADVLRVLRLYYRGKDTSNTPATLTTYADDIPTTDVEQPDLESDIETTEQERTVEDDIQTESLWSSDEQPSTNDRPEGDRQ